MEKRSIVAKIIYGSVATATAVVLSLSVQAQNLLVDPGFETEGATNGWGQSNPIATPSGVSGGWGAFGGYLEFTQAHSGFFSALMVENTWNPQGAYQIVPGTAGDTYTLSAWALDTQTPDYATPVLMQLGFYNASFTQIGTSAGNFEAGPATINTWYQEPATVAVAPAGTAYVYSYLMYMDSDSAGQGMYYDDASLTAVPEPSSLALVGMGLASLCYVIRRRKA